MKFLVINKSKHLIPPEVAAGLMDAMGPWQSKYAGKFEQIWGFAGIQGGGGVFNVESLEELDTIMAEFPFLAFADTEIIPLVDLGGYIQRAKQVLQAMAAGGQG